MSEATIIEPAGPANTNSDMTPEEWQTRLDLAACYRLVRMFGWDDLIYTHLSARVPGPDEHFLINPFGLLYEEVTASNLVKIDLDGNVVSGDYPVNNAGFVIHSCIHRDAPHLHAVLHTHTVAGCAVSAQKHGLLPITQTSMIMSGSVAYHDFEGFALDMDEQKRIVADLGDKRAMILRNHGLLAAGETIAEAFYYLYYMEQACQIQIAAQAGGSELIMPSQAIQDKITSVVQKGIGGVAVGEKEFAALVRRLSATDVSWQQ